MNLMVLVSYDLGLYFFFNFLMMEGDDEPFQAAQVATAVAAALKNDRKKRKLERLKRETKAAQWKALTSKRLVDKESRKRSRSKSTIGSYFVTSGNANNRIEALNLPRPKESTLHGRGRCVPEEGGGATNDSGEWGGATGKGGGAAVGEGGATDKKGGAASEGGSAASEGGRSAPGNNGGSTEVRGTARGEYQEF